VTYIFTGTFAISAETEEEARDGLLELLAYHVARDSSEAFTLEETEEDDLAKVG
jgi:hypothetical protein